MSSAGARGNGDLPLADLIRLDEVCDRYEAALNAGEAPEPAAFLAGIEGPARRILVRELLSLDLEYRSQRGERPEAAAYRALVPGYDDVIDSVFAKAPA